MGFGTANTHKLALDGFVADPGTPESAGAFWLFGETVIQ
jgi:hypothetical protein